MAIQTWDETHGVRTLTDEEFIQEFGERHYREFMGPPRVPVDPEKMTEGERTLYERMQAEGEASAALFAAGLTLDDLVVEGEEVEDGDSDLG